MSNIKNMSAYRRLRKNEIIQSSDYMTAKINQRLLSWTERTKRLRKKGGWMNPNPFFIGKPAGTYCSLAFARRRNLST